MPILGNFPGGGGSGDYFGVCDTAAGTAEKTVSIPGFKLKPGASIAVKFTYRNSMTSPKLNVNNTGAKDVYGVKLWDGNDVVQFVYDGTYWYADKYGLATTSSHGSVQLLPQSFPLSGSSYANTVPTAGQVDAIYNMAKDAKDIAEMKATGCSYGSVKLCSGSFPLLGCSATEQADFVPTASQINAICGMITTNKNSISSLNSLLSGQMKFACSRYTGNGATSRTFTFDFKPYLFVSVAEAAFGYTIIAVRDMKLVGQVNSIPPDATKASNISWGEKSITFSPYGASGTADSMNNYNQASYAYFAIGI